MDNKEEKASDFLHAYTVINEEQKKVINMVPAMNELYSRIKSCASEVRKLQEAIGDLCQWGEMIEKRISELEGKKTIEVVSEAQSKIILKG